MAGDACRAVARPALVAVPSPLAAPLVGVHGGAPAPTFPDRVPAAHLHPKAAAQWHGTQPGCTTLTPKRLPSGRHTSVCRKAAPTQAPARCQKRDVLASGSCVRPAAPRGCKRMHGSACRPDPEACMVAQKARRAPGWGGMTGCGLGATGCTSTGRTGALCTHTLQFAWHSTWPPQTVPCQENLCIDQLQAWPLLFEVFAGDMPQRRTALRELTKANMEAWTASATA